MKKLLRNRGLVERGREGKGSLRKEDFQIVLSVFL